MAASAIEGRICRLRPYAEHDVDALARAADSPDVSRYMRQMFPCPYTTDDARDWIALQLGAEDLVDFAIEFEGRLAGGIGIVPHRNERAGVAEIGYWLAPAFWRRGIATDALRTLSTHAFRVRGLRRLEASVFAPNVVSMHVLAKCGYRREGLLREMYLDRQGVALDGVLFGRLASDPEPAPSKI